MNLEALDLNLLLVLDAVSAEGSVTRAARRLHLTQSAVSNALGRLRGQLGDPLWVRSGRALAPTPRALALAPAVTAALRDLRLALAGGERFDAAASTRRFTLACCDDAAAARLPLIARAFARRLPRAELRVVASDARAGGRALARGDVDLLFGALDHMPADALSDPVFLEDGLCAVWRGAKGGARLSLERFLGLRHVRIRRPGLDEGDLVDTALARLGRARRIALEVPDAPTAALCLPHTPLVATFSRRAAQAFARVLPLRLVTPPLPLPVVTAYQVWHARSDADPGSAVLRQIIRDASGRAPGTQRQK